jgi:D-alanine-D-alanine ligase-like ATP-grasp enzyme
MDQAAIKAVSAVGLDFGAVDFGTDKEGNVWLLEVNTSPGLQGMSASIAAYREHLRGLLKESA